MLKRKPKRGPKGSLTFGLRRTLAVKTANGSSQTLSSGMTQISKKKQSSQDQTKNIAYASRNAYTRATCRLDLRPICQETMKMPPAANSSPKSRGSAHLIWFQNCQNEQRQHTPQLEKPTKCFFSHIAFSKEGILFQIQIARGRARQLKTWPDLHSDQSTSREEYILLFRSHCLSTEKSAISLNYANATPKLQHNIPSKPCKHALNLPFVRVHKSMMSIDTITRPEICSPPVSSFSSNHPQICAKLSMSVVQYIYIYIVLCREHELNHDTHLSL